MSEKVGIKKTKGKKAIQTQRGMERAKNVKL